MFIIIGTISDPNMPITFGQLTFLNSELIIQNVHLPIGRGTSALAAAACVTCQNLGIEQPYGLFAGDTGDGKGSKSIYAWLIENLSEYKPSMLTFHYIQPEVVLHDRVFKNIVFLDKKPFLVADAGFMYVAKMSGHASEYDLFTPDMGELAFLADETSPHPFYTRGFLLHDEMRVDEKVRRANEFGNISKTAIIKGKTDYIISGSDILHEVNEPDVPALEAIGGTGDTITGIVSALISSGYNPVDGSIIACRVNRLAGEFADPSPATQLREILTFIPRAFKKAISEFK